MGYDRHLASEVQGAFVQTVSERIAWLVKRKLQLKSVKQVKTGSVLFTQRSRRARDFGVLGPNSALRAAVVPKPPPVQAEQLPLFTPEDVPLAPPARASSRISWAQLLKRVFKTEVSVCGRCGGNVRVTDAVTEREESRKRLDALGLPSEPPGLHPARAPPQGDFDWDCVS